MHAIAFNEANLPKILKTYGITVEEVQGLSNVFMHRDYVFMTGVVFSDNAPYRDWAILPMFAFAKNYEFDPDKIQTDWDQIVPKQ